MKNYFCSKKLFCFVSAVWALLALLPRNSAAQTNVCPFQPGAHFTRAGSPYTLTCGYTIPAGDSLVVDAGVRLNMGNNGIYVNGKLRLRGTQSDSVFLTTGTGAGINFRDVGVGSLTYVSFRNTSSVVNNTSVSIDNRPITRAAPVIANCRFYSLATATDIFVSLNSATGMRNTVARRVVLGGSRLGGLSGRMVAYGPNPIYELSSSIWLSGPDSLAVEAGVRLKMGAYDIFGDGNLRMAGSLRDSVFVTTSRSATAISLNGAGRVRMNYVSFRNTSTAPTGSYSLSFDNRSNGQRIPAITNCHFYSPPTVIDLSLALTVAPGLHNVIARKVVLWGSRLAGQSTQLVAYGPNPTYELSGSIWLSGRDSLAVEAGVRLNMGPNDIFGDGNIRLGGTQSDSIFITTNRSATAISLNGAGRVRMNYVSFRNTSTAATGSYSVSLDNRSNGQRVPTITNCHFYSPPTVTDLSLGLTVAPGLRNVVVRKVVLWGSRLAGQSTQLVAYGPNPTYELSGSIWLSGPDSLAVEAGVRLNMGVSDIFGDGSLRLRGTQRDSVFVTTNRVGTAISLGGASKVSMNYVRFRNTSTATGNTSVSLDSRNLSIHNCSFSGGGTGIALNTPTTPTLQIDNLRFSNFQTAMAIYSGTIVVTNGVFNGLKPKYGINATGSSKVTALNCNFGHPSGPYNASRNPTGLGCQVTNNVCISTGVLPVANFDFAIDGNNVAFVNTSTNATNYTWSFGNGSTSNLTNPLKTFSAGTYTVCLTATTASTGCVSPSVCKTVSIKGLASITTNHGGNTGTVSVVVRGGGFLPHMQLFLRRAGEADIVGDTVITLNVGVLATTFDLTNKTLGQWDVVIVYPNGSMASLPNGFAIEASTGPKLSINISGSSVLRIGFNQVYTITCVNSGNEDAYHVPLLIKGLPLNTDIEVVSPLLLPENVPGLDTLNISSLNLKLTRTDSSAQTCLRVLFITRLTAGSVTALNIVFHLPISAVLHSQPIIQVSLRTPLSHFYHKSVTPEAASCFGAIGLAGIKKAVGKLLVGATDVTGFGTCANESVDEVLSTLVKLPPTHNNFSKTIDYMNVATSKAAKTLGCARAGITTLALVPGLLPEVAGADLALLALQDLVNFVGAGYAAIDLYNRCQDAYKDAAIDFLAALIGNAWDPNAKYGPGANSFHHYINKAAPLSYSISFENDPRANANAQTVRVTDTLSAQAFDFNTFAFTSVTIGTSTYALPAPAKEFVHDFDFVAQYSVKARVIGTFDATTGIVRWTILSIDPTTNQATTNALLGFLPPDVVSPQGQGYVSYIVQANPARQTGDIIRNTASIVFDYNPAIRTNTWQNVFDLVSPSSSVTAVAPTATDSVFQVSWSGTDVGSAIQSYDIKVTKDGGELLTWLSNTSATTGLFPGKLGSTYCFYSVARDSANNVEAAPSAPDVCQKLTGAAPEALTVHPNPTRGSFTVVTNALQAAPSGIDIVDIVGRVAYHQDIALSSGVQNTQMDITTLAPGLYFVRMRIDGKTVVKKLVKI